jgi:hypothetical protein
MYDPHRHPDVDEHVEQEDRRHADGYMDPETIPGDARDRQYPPDEEDLELYCAGSGGDEAREVVPAA